MVYTTCILVNQCGRDHQTYESALPVACVAGGIVGAREIKFWRRSR